MLEAYLAELRAQGSSSYTLSTYKSVVGKALRWGDFLGYLNSLTCSPYTVAYYGRVLRRYADWAVSKGYLKENPLAGLHFRSPPTKPVCPFSKDELRRMLKACRTSEEEAMLLLLIDTGIRVGELVGLRSDDVLTGGVLRINGKGRRRRLVAISGRTALALTAILGRSRDGPMFELSRHRVWSEVKAIGRRAGIERVYPHRFRHSFANLWLQAGGQENDLMYLAGWSSTKMLLRYTAFHAQERALTAHRRFSPAARL